MAVKAGIEHPWSEYFITGIKIKKEREEMKKFLAMVLAAAMAIGTASVAFADDKVAEYNGTQYATLAEAVQAVIDSPNKTGTVTLLDNASGSGIAIFNQNGVPAGVDLTIDFNGFTYNCDGNLVGSTGTESQVFHFEKGNTVELKNGTITATVKAGMLVQNYCDLTLNNIVLDAKDSSTISYVMSNNCGNVQIIGNSSIYAPDGSVAFDVCWAPNKGYPEGAQVTVDTTGTIDGTVEIGVWGSVEGKPSLSTFNAKNGVFTGSLNVARDLSESSKENVSVEGGLFTDPTWNNPDFTEKADVIAELMDGDDVGAYHIGPASKTIDASDYDGVVVTKAASGAVKVAGSDVEVMNGMDAPLSVNGTSIKGGEVIIVTREPAERDTTGGDYFGNAKWAEVKRAIAAAEEGDTIEMSATGLPWFPSSVARALKGKDVTLEVRKNGVTYSINGLKIGSIDKIWYEFDQIETELLTAEAE